MVNGLESCLGGINVNKSIKDGEKITADCADFNQQCADNSVGLTRDKLKYDKGKLQYSLLPYEAIDAVVEVLTWAITRETPPPYPKGSWKQVEKSAYLDAAGRHYSKYCSGEKNDPESNLSHLAHAACNYLFILWKDLQEGKGNEI